MGDVQSLIDDLWSDAHQQFPFSREQMTPRGNEQVIDGASSSRNSRASRPVSDNSYTSPSEAETGACASARAGAHVEGGVFGPGNAGTAGNVNDHNAIPFPEEIIKTGSAGKATFAGCHSPVVSSWRAAFAALTPAALPCPGFLGREWPGVYASGLRFLDDHAEAAHTLGWDAISLFGVHPVVGATRVDCCGVLMVSSGANVMMVERDVIAFGRTRFFRRALTPDAILVWEFGR